MENQDKSIKIQPIVDEMRSSYLNYAMSVIVSRALPNVRDGLKPVQRRIIYAMYKMGFHHNKAYKKSARTVGEVIGKYHPHGDSSVYEAMVRLTQDFNVRYCLIDGQGNFGSIDGDSAAAMRYTESRLEKISAELIAEIDRNTSNFRENYDGSTKEPDILPSKVPILLLNGADGIAVGMATKIPPHNLKEVCEALIYLIKEGNVAEESIQIPNYKDDLNCIKDIKSLDPDRFPDFKSEKTAEDLIKIIKGPDFPTGAEIYDQEEILNAYKTGKGRILMRAIARIEEVKGGKFQIVIDEIPFQVNKARLVAKFADLVKNKQIQGISDIRDESNKEGIRIVLDIKREGKPKTILNRLYKYTEMQKAFNANILALVDGEPKVLTLKKALELFIKHRQEVVVKRTEYDLGKSREREHILEGLMIALDHLDEVIQTIRNSKDSEVAKENLIKKFNLSEIQAQAILDMQLRRLAALERQKIEDEYKEIKITIANLLEILTTPQRVLNIISEETTDIKDKFGDKRKTKVNKGKVGEIDEIELIGKEEVIVTISKQGYIKRLKENTYESQKRGGIGKKIMSTKEDDSIKHVLPTNTHDDILFFTSKGRVFKIKVHEIPEVGRTAKGQPIINMINIDQKELITSVLTRNKDGNMLDEDILQEGEEEKENQGVDYKFLLMATKNGVVKKTKISEFERIQSNGIIAIKLKKDDDLIWVRPTTGESEVILTTKHAKSIRFEEKDVKAVGRNSQGVIGIKFKDNSDQIISMDVVRKEEVSLFTISEQGYGKITSLDQYSIQKRGGQGIYAAKISKKTGNLVSSRIIDHPNKDLLILSKDAQAVKTPVKDIPVMNRNTMGVKMIRLRKGDNVAAIAII